MSVKYLFTELVSSKYEQSNPFAKASLYTDLYKRRDVGLSYGDNLRGCLPPNNSPLSFKLLIYTRGQIKFSSVQWKTAR